MKFKADEVLNLLSSIVENGQKQKLNSAKHCSCALHSCSNLLDDYQQCTAKIGSLDKCGDQCTTRKVSYQNSFVSTPPNVDPENLSDKIVEASCIYQDIDKVFQKFTGHLKSWAYFGAACGVTINWPGVPSPRGLTGPGADEKLGGCEQYDPRIRPWFLDATSAPRNIIILVDASSSMGQSAGFGSGISRWELAKNVAHTIIGITKFSDVVTVLALNEENLTDADDFLYQNLVLGDGNGQKELKDRLESIRPTGDKKIKHGIKFAFEILTRAQKQEIKSTGCQQVIFLVTDGHLCNKKTGEECAGESQKMQEILTVIHEEQENLISGLTASIFVTTVGEDRDDRLAKQITCRNDALWIPILSGTGLLEQLHPFISFFASRVIQNNDRIIWSHFYEDFSGLGTMTTGTRSVFSLHDTATARKGELVGVIGYDIPLSDLEANGLRYEEIVGQLSRNIGECNVHPIDFCQLQILRGSQNACPVFYPPSKCYTSPKHDHHVFYSSVLDKKRHTFDEAHEFCVNHGGRLAEIGDDDAGEDQIHLSSLAAMDGSWIGLNFTDSNQWKWISGRNSTREIFTSSIINERKGHYCAALDSGSVKNNIESRNCSNLLYFICEFISADAAGALCQKSEIYDEFENQVTEKSGDSMLKNLSSNNTSFRTCLADLSQKQKKGMMESETFMSYRKRLNDEPVFCSLGLHLNISSAEAQCCSTCLQTSSSRSYDQTASLTSEDSEDEMTYETSLAFSLSFKILPFPFFFLFFCWQFLP